MKKGISKRITIRANRSEVFDALTNPDAIKSYFPIEEVKSDWEAGERIEFVSDGGGIDEGLIEIFNQDSCFQYSYWNQNHGREKNRDNFVTISYNLEDADSEGEVLLTMKQMNLPSVSYEEIMDPIWDQLLESLKLYVESSDKQCALH